MRTSRWTTTASWRASRAACFLVKRGGEPLAVLMSGPAKEYQPMAQVSIQVMAPDRDVAERFLAGLRTAMRKRNVYRGHVLSLAETRMGTMEIKFHKLPSVPRENIILPEGLLERIERQTVRFSELSEKLVAAGRHLKRGILLHGPPGTGKTLTAMYVARAIRESHSVAPHRSRPGDDRAVVCPARLQPAIVILEDVDLVAEERTRPGAACAGPLLFELLNQMDGLADDADVLFLLTTNRPDILEPALAVRPGRVDQADRNPLARCTVPPAAVRALLRPIDAGPSELGNLRSANRRRQCRVHPRNDAQGLRCSPRTKPSETVEDRHLDEAIHELVVEGGSLTQSLLGFATNSDRIHWGPEMKGLIREAIRSIISLTSTRQGAFQWPSQSITMMGWRKMPNLSA